MPVLYLVASLSAFLEKFFRANRDPLHAKPDLYPAVRSIVLGDKSGLVVFECFLSRNQVSCLAGDRCSDADFFRTFRTGDNVPVHVIHASSSGFDRFTICQCRCCSGVSGFHCCEHRVVDPVQPLLEPHVFSHASA